MPTTVTRTIGTGGDYSTPQAWEDACPANLVAVDQIWRGELKNQTFGTGSGNVLTIGGITTDATRYVELTTEAGASFIDSVNIETNALRYNPANGAALNGGGGYSDALTISTDTHVLLSRFMIQHSGAGPAINQAGDGGFTQIRQLIAESSGSVNQTVILRGSNSWAANSLLVNRSTGQMFRSRSNASLYGCTLARTGTTPAGSAIGAGYSNPTVRNCALFGLASVHDGGSPAYTNCFTNVASPPSGCTTTAYSTSTGAQFQNITDGSHDYRIKTGSTLKDAGTADVTFGTPSINGRARPEGAAYDVGAWEFADAGSGSTANGVTLTAAASLIAGSASGPMGMLNFQGAGMEFGRRTGLGISTFALDAGANYRYTVHADGLVLGAALITSGVVATDSAGKLPNVSNAALTPGVTYRVVAIRQADGEATPAFRMVAS